MKAVLVFIDGIICDNRQRQHLSGAPEFYKREVLMKDAPTPDSVRCLHELAQRYLPVYLTARPETAKAEWLKLAGFELELTMERVMLYRGVPEAECVYTWISPEALANCADDGPVAGENQ